jgi:glycosyltransferase involved in cell wall biosynthesis
MNFPLITIVVPTYNDSATIERCVLSMEGQSWPNLEILVIDDGSSDSTPGRLQELEQRCPRLRTLALPKRSGAAAARNLGFEQAKGEIVALIDGDMWAPADWLALLVDPIQSDRADVTGGPDYVPPDAPLLSRCIGYSMDSLLTNAGLRLGDTKLVKYLPGTGNMAIRSDLLQRAGHFDETFHDTGEDKEWLHRVREAGGRFVYLPDALAWHERRPDLVLHARKQVLSGRRRLDIVLKDPASFEWPHFAPAALLLFLSLGSTVAALREVWLAVLLSSLLAILLDGLHGAWKLRDWRAFPVLLFSSSSIPVGYGLGVLWRGVEVLSRRTSS